MDLSIIIVSYNTEKILEDCLTTIKASKDKLKKEVIVVDNDSSDESVEMVRKRFPEYKVIDTGENGGFAKGNNIGAAVAKGKYVWLLNSDTLLKPNTIQTLVDVVEENGVEIASCKLLNNDGTIQQQGGYLPNLLNLFAWMLFLDDIPLVKRLFKPYQQRNRGFFRKNQKVGWLGGTALLVKRDLYNKMGGLDEKIFMYGEDVDFAIRAKKMGVPIYYFSEPSLTHLGQASGSSKGAVIGEFKGLKYVYRKHKSWPQLLILRTLLKIGALMRILVFGYLIGDKERKDVYSEAFKVA